MLRGSLIFSSFALKKDLYLKKTHVFRFACVGIVFLILFSSWVTSSRTSSPGLDFFTKIVWLNFWLVTLAGIGFFSTAITEEKEEETLPLLKLAGINTLALLLGKSTVRASRVILLLMGQLPFLMIAVALGGITAHQIYAAIGAMVAYVLLIANFSLLCSVYAKRSGGAIALVMSALFLFFFSPFVMTKLLSNLQSRGYMATNDSLSQGIVSYIDYCNEISVTNSLNTILTTGYSGSVMSTQVITNSLIGAGCFIIAWLIFERCTETNPVLEKRMGFRWHKRKKKSRPGRLAISWKEFHFLSGGTKALQFKSIIYLSGILSVVGGGIFLDHYSSPTFVFPYSWKELMNTSLLLLVSGFVVESTIYFSRIFREERTQNMLPLLSILPLSLTRIAYEKIGAYLLALMPVCSGICIIVLISPDSAFNLFESGYHSLFILFLIQFIVFLHLLTYFSIVVRWGALAFSIGTLILIDSCAAPFLQIIFLMFNKVFGETGFLLPLFYLALLSCFVLQILIVKRLHQIASEE